MCIQSKKKAKILRNHSNINRKRGQIETLFRGQAKQAFLAEETIPGVKNNAVNWVATIGGTK